MIRYLLSFAALIHSQALNAGLVEYFKDEQGDTNWQYVANWSSGILILLLSITLVVLFFSHLQARRANRALRTIRNELEERVLERTATLDKSNALLKEEIAQHRETTALLRSSEAYIKNILESMPSMLIGLDRDGHVTQWNKRAQEITGISTDNALGKNLWSIYPTITVTPDQVRHTLEQSKTTTIKHSQRGQYYFDITIYPLREQADAGVVVLVDDVTQRILAENMLIQRDKMSSMGELASTMAHDIDIPLQAAVRDIRAAREALATSVGSEENIGHFNSILADAAEKGEQMSAMIRNLLEFANSSSDEKRLAHVPDIVEHSLELAGDVLSVPSGLHFKDIAIERHYEEGLPEIPCYVSELQQVFLSLFRHACHALGQARGRPDHRPTIRIEVMECYDTLWVRIQHNGVGLTPEEQQYIFEPFFINNTSKTSERDYDAGKRLSFSYFIITEHHKGQMAVTSDVNVGTTFHMQLLLDSQNHRTAGAAEPIGRRQIS